MRAMREFPRGVLCWRQLSGQQHRLLQWELLPPFGTSLLQWQMPAVLQ
jgi:hypothetical protein